ncbi:MAG TPA: hypothetical protein VGR41_07965 [Actinomycetota bacterium]|jgi:hypothetical protein|nr:hypothetical protein [Actinomycetota bacterium]
MSARIFRASMALLASTFLLLGMSSGFPHARAQDQTVATLTLERQTPFVFVTEDPVMQLRVRAENLSDVPLEDLSIGMTLGLAVRTRSAYDASLLDGPALILSGDTRTVDGSLQPGQSRTLDIQLDLVAARVSTTESLIYPLRIDLRVGDLPIGAELRTPVLVLARVPEQPLELTWIMELDPAPALGTDGTLTDPSFAETIAPGGALRGEIDALGVLASGPEPSAADVAISPRFLDELDQMSDGFSTVDGSAVRAGEGAATDAADVLETLRAVAASGVVEVSALPYAAPNLPALLRSSLAADVVDQVELGDSVFLDVLGVAPSTTVARAPGGALDDATIEQFSVQGSGVVLADSDTIDRPPNPDGLSLAPTGLIACGFRDLPVTLPDPGIQALLSGPTTTLDPTLAAQAVLGELAAVWQEAPGEPRGVVISTAGLTLPARFWETFGRRVADAPFLRPVSATRLIEDIPPTDAPQPLATQSTALIQQDYTELIKRERRRVDALESMLEDPAGLPDRLRVSMLVAESGAFVGNESSGRQWIDGVSAVTRSVFDAATPRTSQQFTLDSTSGTIPIRLGDPGDRILNVVIELSSSRLRFPQGSERSVRITEPDQIVFFPVETTSTGQITVVAVVKAPLPSGRTVAETNLIIRSTAYSRIALIVTGGAALALVLLWARRFIRRATS